MSIRGQHSFFEAASAKEAEQRDRSSFSSDITPTLEVTEVRRGWFSVVARWEDGDNSYCTTCGGMITTERHRLACVVPSA